MKPGPSFTDTAIGLTLLAAFTFCYFQNRGFNLDVHYKIENFLKQINVLEEQLEGHCLRARSGMLQSYDSLVALRSLLVASSTNLKSLVAESSLPNKRELSEAKKAVDSQLEEEFQIVEQFKSANSILRGSVRYLPIVYAAALGQSDKKTAESLQKIFQQILILQVSPQAELQASIRTDAGQLRWAGKADVSDVKTFLIHVDHILEYQDKVDSALTLITAEKDDQRLSELHAVYIQGYSELVRRKEKFQTVMYGLFVLVLAYLAYVVGKLRSAFVRLKEANSQLENNVVEIKMLQAKTADKVLKRTEERNRLNTAVKALERVLGVIGHELRTPLASLRVMTEFVLTASDRQDPEFDEFLNLMHEEVIRMAGDVNDLLEVARLNSGLAKWNWTEFHLDGVCRDAIDSIRPLVDKQKVDLSVGVVPHDLTMLGDCAAVRRLLTNLINNAFKNTEAGSIRIAGRYGDSERKTVEIQIADTGSGMERHIGERLGVAFALNSGVTGEQHVKGSGLGLAICRGIVAAHGGELTVESGIGMGTTVTVILPACLSEPKPADGAVQVRYIERTGDAGISADIAAELFSQ